MREIFVAKLVKDVLGPRNGIYEVMQDSPLSEYITGVLAPVGVLARELGEEMVHPYIPEIEEDEVQEQDVHTPPLLSPALDPQNRPPSFGISFMVESDDVPSADICLSWARYTMFGQGSSVQWQREPRYAIFSINLNQSAILWFDSSGQRTFSQNAEISFHVISKERNKNRWLVNLYFVNRIKVPPGRNPTAEHHIFQPQIRVVCQNRTRIVPAELYPRAGEETQELAFLYRNRPAMARGFLCSAIWRDIDPQRIWYKELNFPFCRHEPPFSWIDGQLLPPLERQKFEVPDVRSEFTPLYSIPFPDMSWPQEYGPQPELRAQVLADAFHCDVLKEALEPIVSAYERWVNKLWNQASTLSAAERQIADNLIQKCQNVLRRMQAGLSLLLNDDNVRLCFCFANKAMDIQAQWTRGQSLIWRPFQLGYILMVLESLVNSQSSDRNICDLLWVPTGAGKTEAYLFLIIFVLAFRRRKAIQQRKSGAGVTVITRYTLRLLTIQQFRRLLAAITACEYLRVEGLGSRQSVGWKPQGCNEQNNFIWGSEPFSAGLWVGGGVTPNRLRDTWSGNRNIPGALSILKGRQGEGEPAQITHCPACGSLLAIPAKGISGKHILHLVIQSPATYQQIQNACNRLRGMSTGNITINTITVTPHTTQGFFTLSIDISIQGLATARDVDDLWRLVSCKIPENSTLSAVRASRPGYFIRWYQGQRGKRQEYDFEIFCGNPRCPLHCSWCAGAPLGSIHGTSPHPFSPTGGISNIPPLSDGNRFIHIQEAFRNGNPYISDRIPIPACTVDEQVYHHLPSVVVATVDKFARPAFESRASALFGNIDHYHCIWGYYRKGIPPSLIQNHDGHPSPLGSENSRNYIQVQPLDPPELIIQDELHLIEGPLGSLVGFYETAVEYLCNTDERRVKYIASTATVRNAKDQVQAVFIRELAIFPPPGLSADDRFFIRGKEVHPLDDSESGRLYLGICAPGRGPLTPLVRIYACLLQTAEDVRDQPSVDIDSFWTLTCYFNAIRELGGARALYRQDIPERLMHIAGNRARQIPDDRMVELSSRTDSTDLPAILNYLSTSYPDAPDALFTTSMFGTGVDIPRLSLMVVNGQPKTTSSYIQCTGRVGRQKGALVVTFFRASRPRDLIHYEFFCGYHRQLHRFVESITVYPFAPGVLERATGSLSVFMLRNMRYTTVPWHEDASASLMSKYRQANEVRCIPHILEERAQNQPVLKRPSHNFVQSYTSTELDRWQNVANLHFGELRYAEYITAGIPQSHVVLGDSQHQHVRNIDVVYENAPQSLREIEETCGFET